VHDICESSAMAAAMGVLNPVVDCGEALDRVHAHAWSERLSIGRCARVRSVWYLCACCCICRRCTVSPVVARTGSLLHPCVLTVVSVMHSRRICVSALRATLNTRIDAC
jgi:hypothetical protein